MRTSWEACKVGIAAFLVPYIFIWTTMILLLPEHHIEGLAKIMACLMALVFFQALVAGTFIVRFSRIEAALAGISVVACMAFIFTYMPALLIVGIACLAILVVWQARKGRLLRLATEVANNK